MRWARGDEGHFSSNVFEGGTCLPKGDLFIAEGNRVLNSSGKPVNSVRAVYLKAVRGYNIA